MELGAPSGVDPPYNTIIDLSLLPKQMHHSKHACKPDIIENMVGGPTERCEMPGPGRACVFFELSSKVLPGQRYKVSPIRQVCLSFPSGTGGKSVNGGLGN